MKKCTLPTSVFILTTFLILLIDQITKHYIRAAMPLGTSIPIIAFTRFTHVSNSGASFSIFTNYSFLLGVIAVFAIIAAIVFYRKIPEECRLPGALILGGAIGNLIDRIRFGAVTDFIDVTYWPIFNIADAAITVAAVMLIIIVWKEDVQVFLKKYFSKK
jgi:signal peptidase II